LNNRVKNEPILTIFGTLNPEGIWYNTSDFGILRHIRKISPHYLTTVILFSRKNGLLWKQPVFVFHGNLNFRQATSQDMVKNSSITTKHALFWRFDLIARSSSEEAGILSSSESWCDDQLSHQESGRRRDYFLKSQDMVKLTVFRSVMLDGHISRLMNGMSHGTKTRPRQERNSADHWQRFLHQQHFSIKLLLI